MEKDVVYPPLPLLFESFQKVKFLDFLGRRSPFGRSPVPQGLEDEMSPSRYYVELEEILVSLEKRMQRPSWTPGLLYRAMVESALNPQLKPTLEQSHRILDIVHLYILEEQTHASRFDTVAFVSKSSSPESVGAFRRYSDVLRLLEWMVGRESLTPWCFAKVLEALAALEALDERGVQLAQDVASSLMEQGHLEAPLKYRLARHWIQLGEALLESESFGCEEGVMGLLDRALEDPCWSRKVWEQAYDLVTRVSISHRVSPLRLLRMVQRLEERLPEDPTDRSRSSYWRQRLGRVRQQLRRDMVVSST